MVELLRPKGINEGMTDVNLEQREIISIEGTLLMLDGKTPHIRVPVQAICEGQVIQATLSDYSGRYRFVNLSPGSYQLRCQVLGGYVYYRAIDHALRSTFYDSGTTESAMEDDLGDILRIQNGKTLANIDFHFAPFKKGTWRHHTPLDGLAHNDVHTMFIDPGGIIWFGTEGGVSRYDGKGYTNFSVRDGLVSNSVDAICRAHDGAIWFATRGGGVSCYNGNKFASFTEEDGLSNNDVRAICCAPNGDLWFGTQNGVSRYDGKKFVTFRTENGLAHNKMHTNSIHCDSDGVMWFGTENGLSRYDGREFFNLNFDEGIDKNWNFIHAVYRDREGFLWIGTRSGVLRYDGEDFVKFAQKDGLPTGYIISIYQDFDGSMWFGIAFSRSPAVRYDGKAFVNFTEEDGISDANVTAIHRGPDGAMWFATDGGGVSRYDDKEFINFTVEDGLSGGNIFAIQCCPDGKLWVGADHFLYLHDGECLRDLTREDGTPYSGICTIYSDTSGVIWFGTYSGGVYRYDGKNVTDIGAEEHLNLPVNSIYQDTDGTIWFGAGTVGRGCLTRYDGMEFVTFTMKDGPMHSSILCIYEDPGGMLWIGTRGGLYRYDRGRFTNLTREEGLAFGRVNAINTGPDGVLWIGTSSGILRYDGAKFTNITTQDGLPHDFINAIYFDLDGILWLGTDGGGIAMYDGITWSSLDTRDGLAGNAVKAIAQDPDGSIWFGTDHGLTRYRPSPSRPEVRIVSITTDQTYRDPLSLPGLSIGQRVTIEYDSLDFKTVSEKRQYRYRIREIDADWRKPTRATSYDHVFHKEGDYTFEVQAIDRDLNYSEPAVLTLTVNPDPRLVSLQKEVNHLRREVGQKYHFDNIIGRSAVIRQVRALMERAIDSGLTVLITGETGTGKELVAKAIHYHSPRRDHPLLDRNCGAIPRELLASDLFGHRKGAFTGAAEDKAGLFEAASGGTVMLDEISEMPEDAQVHLLRVLQERKVQRLGEHISRDVDVRVIAMTNRNLVREVTDGRFREDLYYRLNEFPIHIPALRERAEDIPILAEHFLQEIDKEVDGFAPDVFEMLQSYPWPGNVRELRNEVHRACALVEEGARIQSYHFSPQVTRGESLIQNIISEKLSYSDSLDLFRRRLVDNALRACNGNRHEAAKMLGMARPNLVALIKRLGIK
jgi:DNA-binding NtrC family response regulator/ligand-binding sensor domain-containing protein